MTSICRSVGTLCHAKGWGYLMQSHLIAEVVQSQCKVSQASLEQEKLLGWQWLTGLWEMTGHQPKTD